MQSNSHFNDAKEARKQFLRYSLIIQHLTPLHFAVSSVRNTAVPDVINLQTISLNFLRDDTKPIWAAEITETGYSRLNFDAQSVISSGEVRIEHVFLLAWN